MSSSRGAKKAGATRMRVGKYEIGKTLGEGSFGKVKFGRHVQTGHSVAIKIIDRDHVLRHKMVDQVCSLFFFLFIFYSFSHSCSLNNFMEMVILSLNMKWHFG